MEGRTLNLPNNNNNNNNNNNKTNRRINNFTCILQKITLRSHLRGSSHFLTGTSTRVAHPLFVCRSWTPPSAILRPWLRAAAVPMLCPGITGFATNCPCLPARPFSMHCSREKIRLLYKMELIRKYKVR